MTKIGLHKVRRKTGHVWVLRWWDHQGKRPSEKIGKCSEMTKKDAQYLQRQKQGAMDAGTIRPDKPRKMTLEVFKKYHADVIATDVRDSSVIQYGYAFDKLIATLGKDAPIDRLSPADVGRVKSAMSNNGSSSATIRKTMSHLRAAWNRALAHGLVISNPFAKLGMKAIESKESRIFEREEIAKLIQKTPDNWWKAFLSLAFSSGLRRNEMLNLRRDDVDLDAGTITVQPRKAGTFTADGKEYPVLEWSAKCGSSHRTVPIPADVCVALRRLQAKSDGSIYLFLSLERLASIQRRIDAGEWSSNDHLINNLITRWHTIQKAALGQKTKLGTIHDMRKTCLTHLAHTIPMHLLSRVAGHSSITTTAKFYTGVRESDADLIRQATEIGPDLRLVG